MRTLRHQLVALTVAALLLRATAMSAQAGTQTAQKTAPGTFTLPKLPTVHGTQFDQVLAIVNGDLILDSDLDQERRFEELQPYREAAAAPTRERMLERLIDRTLILQQSQLQPQDEIPEADVTREIDQLRRSIPASRALHTDTKEGWDRYLAEHGFTEDEFRQRWRQRMQVLAFIEQRFRMGIKIPPADIESYYRTTLLPQYAAQHAVAPPLAVLSDRIQEVLLSQQVSNLLGDWLKSLRAQGNVVVLHPGEDAP
jgi:parvulin-like peptidyl-prolyl isomerase